MHEAIATAAQAGAEAVFLPELTLSRYPADTKPTTRPCGQAETLDGGPTHSFAAEAEAAAANGVHVHASLYEQADEGDGLGYNTPSL